MRETFYINVQKKAGWKIYGNVANQGEHDQVPRRFQGNCHSTIGRIRKTIFLRNPQIKVEYIRFIHEYLELEYMSELQSTVNDDNIFTCHITA